MLEVINLQKSYKTAGGTYDVLKDVNIKINDGEFVAIMGRSGSGKTTLLNSISKFIPADSGQIKLNDIDILKANQEEISLIRRDKMGFIHQDFMLLNGLSVFDNIVLPQVIAKKDVGINFDKVEELINLLDIHAIKNKYPVEISGGQKQRCAIARALSNEPLIILADEPTGNLDSKSGKDVIDAFIKIKETLNATILMVTHDPIVACNADRIIFLNDGIITDSLVKEDNKQIYIDKIVNRIEIG